MSADQAAGKSGLALGFGEVLDARQGGGHVRVVLGEAAVQNAGFLIGSAMAVGCNCQRGPDGGLISHWNGHAWKRERSPVRAFGSSLAAVAMSSAHSAWAVGRHCTSQCSSGAAFYTTLILRWNGSAWQRLPHPSGKLDSLFAVAAASASSAWAVGQTGNGRVLIPAWDGHSWRAG